MEAQLQTVLMEGQKMKFNRRTVLGCGAGLAFLGGTPVEIRAQAAKPPAGSAPQPPSGVSAVEVVRAPAWLVRNGVRNALKAGTTVMLGDSIQTGIDGRALVRMPEGSTVSLGANSEFVVDALSVGTTSSPSLFSAALRLATGTMRYVTALAQKANGANRDVKVRTATATIGIRGTRFWAQCVDEGETVCLFEGKVDIAREGEPLAVLDQPNAFWIAPYRKPAQPVAIASAQQLATFGGQVSQPEGSGLIKADGGFRLEIAAISRNDGALVARQLNRLGYAAEQLATSVVLTQFASAADAQAVADRLRRFYAIDMQLVKA
jgi:hypothetical protein